MQSHAAFHVQFSGFDKQAQQIIRSAQVERLLASDVPVPIALGADQEPGDPELVTAQQSRLLALACRTMARPLGRGALTLGALVACMPEHCCVLKLSPGVTRSIIGPFPAALCVQTCLWISASVLLAVTTPVNGGDRASHARCCRCRHGAAAADAGAGGAAAGAGRPADAAQRRRDGARHGRAAGGARQRRHMRPIRLARVPQRRRGR